MSAQPESIFQPLEPDDPTEVGTYRLTARLGAGGMGKVYLSHTPAGRPVAIKVIRPEFAEDPSFRLRFKQEVQAAQRVHGLCTAPVVDSDADGPRPWLATAFVQGPTLASAVAGHGALPLPTVLLLVAGIAEALQAVHAAGLVHRDLKPSNVLLAADGPRVIDFGIARAADATALTDSGVTVGTPSFMSPEQAAGREITPATDVFALGQVAAYAATGSPAYGEGPSHAVLYRIVHEEPDLSGLPDALRPLVTRCLDKDPARRPSLAEAVAMCQAASDGTQLVRPEQWLPATLAAEIPTRHAVPGHPPTATAPPPPAAQPTVTAAPTPPPTALGGPPTPPPAQQFAHEPTQLAQPPAPPRPGAGYGYPGHPGGPGGHPTGQPSAHPTGYPGGYQGAYQGGPPGGYPRPGQFAPRPYPVHPLPPKKNRAPMIVGLVVCGFIVLSVVSAAIHALGGTHGDDTANGSGGHAGTGTGTNPAARHAPKPESHPGVQLADGYHLEFADADLQPHYNNYDDFYYMCDMVNGCNVGAYNTRLVLLDQGEKGSLDACLKDTRYADTIEQARLSAGSQICARTEAGTVALLTYKGGSKHSDPSTYTVWDVTLWRNAIPSQS